VVEENIGGTWAIVPSPAGGLAGMDCYSATSCIAVGYSETTKRQVFYVTHSPSTPFGDWLVEPAAKSDGYLGGVTCASDEYCVAIGWYAGGDTLVEEKRDGAWQILRDAPNSSLGHALGLSGIACPSVTHCVIVGTQYIGVGSSLGTTLIEENNGNGWTIVTSPNATWTMSCWRSGSRPASSFAAR
jgi:hypothetical protein